MAQSVLVIPVPEADFMVRPRRERGSPEYLHVDREDVVAHITLLTPFADVGDLGDHGEVDAGLAFELRSLFADVLPFDYQLTRVSEFSGGAAYLSLAPAAPFRHLVARLRRQFPEYPPYAGDFDEVAPHVTVPVPQDADVARLGPELAPSLPIRAYAHQAALCWFESGRSRTLERFPFGTTAA